MKINETIKVLAIMQEGSDYKALSLAL